MDDLFLTAEKLYVMIDNLVWQDDISYIDATLAILEKIDMEYDDLVKYKLITPMLYEHLNDEGMSLGLLVNKKTSLPLDL